MLNNAATATLPTAGLGYAAAHIAGLVLFTGGVIFPLARPNDVKYEVKKNEKLIDLPIRPPILVFGSWFVSLAARELPKYLQFLKLKTLPISQVLNIAPMYSYLGGWALWAVSTGLIVRTVIVMNKHKTPVPHGKAPSQKVVSTGPFSVFRHPIYVGFVGTSLSMSFLLDSVFSFAGFFVSLGYLVGYVMPVEEKWMTNKFGSNYTSYASRVKRFYFF